MEPDGPRLPQQSGQRIARVLIDASGRVSLPAEFREELAGGTIGLLRPSSRTSYGSEAKKVNWLREYDPQTKSARPVALSDDFVGEGGIDLAVYMIQWAGDNFPGMNKLAVERPVSKSVLKRFHASLQKVYAGQLVAFNCTDLKASLLDYPAYRAAYDIAFHDTDRKGKAFAAHLDPQHGTTEDGMKMSDLISIVRHYIAQQSLLSAQHRAIVLYLFATTGRGDEARSLRLADILPPRPIEAIGPSTCFILPVILRNTKILDSGCFTYSGSIRNSDPVMCSHNALAFYLIHKFTVEGHRWPSLACEDSAGWNNYTLFGGCNPMSYQEMYECLKKTMLHLDINCGKVTHGMRGLSARALDSKGIHEKSIQRQGRWTDEVLFTAYCEFFCLDACLAIGNWPGAAKKDFSQFFHPRFQQHVPEELIDVCFPSLAAMRQELIMGGAELKARPSKRNLPQTLHYLAMVAVQDALELVDVCPEHPVINMLLHQPAFVRMVQSYKSQVRAGYWETVRPKEASQRMLDMEASLYQHRAELTEMHDTMRHQGQTLQRIEQLVGSGLPGGPSGSTTPPQVAVAARQSDWVMHSVAPSAARRLAYSTPQRTSPSSNMQGSSPQQTVAEGTTPYWKAQRPGPGVFTSAWQRELGSQTNRPAALASAALPAMVYEPTLGTAAIAPASFTQIVAEQVIARILSSLPSCQTIAAPTQQNAAQPPDQPTSASVPARQPLQPAQPCADVVPLADGRLPMAPAGLLTALPAAIVAAPAAPAVRVLPTMSAISNLPDLFSRWFNGVDGMPPLRELPMEERKGKSVKQRWSEWTKFFAPIEQQLDAGRPVDDVMKELQDEHEQLSATASASSQRKRSCPMSVAGFVAIKVGKRKSS